MRAQPFPPTPDVVELIALFDGLFRASAATVLVRGDGEPFYAPRSGGTPAQVVFAHGFFASALHEIAHWCIAGAERRAQPDYGYWYKPDGRTAAEQREFERVEVRPQALEWIFSVAAGTAFNFSADNLGAGGAVASRAWVEFQRAVAAQAQAYVRAGLPARAGRFAAALSQRYGTGRRYADPAVYGRP